MKRASRPQMRSCTAGRRGRPPPRAGRARGSRASRPLPTVRLGAMRGTSAISSFCTGYSARGQRRRATAPGHRRPGCAAGDEAGGHQAAHAVPEQRPGAAAGPAAVRVLSTRSARSSSRRLRGGQAAARAVGFAVAVLVVAAHGEAPAVERAARRRRSGRRARPGRAPAARRRAAGTPSGRGQSCTARLSPSLAVKVERVDADPVIGKLMRSIIAQARPRRQCPWATAPGRVTPARPQGIRAITSATAAVSRLA